jgi:predicted porin
MNKKIAAVAVAGLFAAPVAALAQSSVTISGILKTSFENLNINNYAGSPNLTGVAGTGRGVSSGKNSQYGLTDDSSRIIFNVREDLGGGLAAIGQLDIRVKLDDRGNSAATNPANIISGNSHVGLQSNSWGRIIFGRQDLHYGNTSSNMTSKANSLRSDPISLLAYAGAYGLKGSAVNGGTAIAGGTRTENVVMYTTPNWSGFTGIIAYSSSPLGVDTDLGNVATQSIRRGNAWNLNPDYLAANWQVGYSYWRSKPDAGMPLNFATVPATPAGVAGIATNYGAADQRAHRIYGNYTFGFGLKIGIAWDNSKLEGNTTIADGTTLSKRTVWSIPVRYEFMGKHTINAHYTWAKDDKANVLNGVNGSTGANMWAVGYNYDLSKRTAVGLTWAKINNQSNAGYNFFTNTSLGLGTAGLRAGEDPRLLSTTIRHAF